MNPPDRVLVTICRGCHRLLGVVVAQAERRLGKATCPFCKEPAHHVRYQLVARGVAAPPRTRTVGKPRAQG